MSKIKELRENPEYNINMVDLVTMVTPTKKSKYVELFLRIQKTKEEDSKKVEFTNEISGILNERYNIPIEDITKLSPLRRKWFYTFFDTYFHTSEIESFQKFCEYNERGLITQNDLTTYKSYDDLLTQLSIAELKVDVKNLEKQIHKIFENDEWLLLRPLTFESSMKYGSNTKWCTTMKNHFDHFHKYSNGILIYVINKVTGLKVACHKTLNDLTNEVSFWDQKDDRIDSMYSNLPYDILMVIKNEIENNQFSNFSLLRKNEQLNEIKRHSNYLPKASTSERALMSGMVMEQPEPPIENVTFGNQAMLDDVEINPTVVAYNVGTR